MTLEADLELEAETQSTPCGSSHDDDLLMRSFFHVSEAIAYKFTTALERVSASGDHGWMISNDLNISLTCP